MYLHVLVQVGKDLKHIAVRYINRKCTYMYKISIKKHENYLY